MSEEEVKKIVDERLDFVYNVKYRFDKPTEFAKPIFMRDLPTSSTGLKVGQLWNDTGTIKVII